MVHFSVGFERYDSPEARAKIHCESCRAIIAAEIVVLPPYSTDGSAGACFRPA
jgi:hypothetical protein